MFLPFTEGKSKSQYPFMNRDPSVELDVNEHPHEILNGQADATYAVWITLDAPLLRPASKLHTVRNLTSPVGHCLLEMVSSGMF